MLHLGVGIVLEIKVLVRLTDFKLFLAGICRGLYIRWEPYRGHLLLHRFFKWVLDF